jgi:hypothetical protein
MRPCSLHTRSPSLLPSTQPRAETNRVAARAAGDGGPSAVRCGLCHLHDRAVDAAVIEHPLVTSFAHSAASLFPRCRVAALPRCRSDDVGIGAAVTITSPALFRLTHVMITLPGKISYYRLNLSTLDNKRQ